MGPTVLVIDNYDSFVYNLVQYVGELGGNPVVYRNADITAAQVGTMTVDGILISPGPGRPEDAGVSNDLIREFAGVTPIFGVCLGHQCIGQVFGGDVVRAPEIMHGKTSMVEHHNQGVFAGVVNPVQVTRYHSLVIDPASMPAELEVTALTADGIVMGVRHRVHAIEGVQFHPESILTISGHQMVANFLATL